MYTRKKMLYIHNLFRNVYLSVIRIARDTQPITVALEMRESSITINEDLSN